MRMFAVLAGVGVLLVGTPMVRAQEAAGFWSTPAIHGFGRIHDLPNAAYRPRPDQTYRVVFSVAQAAKSPSAVNAGLDHVARTVNLYVASGVPLSHLKFVAVVSGAATPLVLDDAQYRAKFGVANPNLPLIAELREAGVDVAICAQAAAEHEIAPEQVDKGVTLALSALTTVTTLEHQGYSYLQF